MVNTSRDSDRSSLQRNLAWRARLWQWFDRNILELGREMRLSYLPPLMVYAAAGISGLTGIAINQAHIWSQPSRAIDDFADYEREFPAASTTNETDWQLTPITGGLGVRIRF